MIYLQRAADALERQAIRLGEAITIRWQVQRSNAGVRAKRESTCKCGHGASLHIEYERVYQVFIAMPCSKCSCPNFETRGRQR